MAASRNPKFRWESPCKHLLPTNKGRVKKNEYSEYFPKHNMKSNNYKTPNYNINNRNNNNKNNITSSSNSSLEEY